MKKKFLIMSLIAVMLLTLAGCGGKDAPASPESGKTDPAVSDGSESVNKEDTGSENPGEENPGEENPGEEHPNEENPGSEPPAEGDTGYTLPAGAASEYDLYKAVLNYLNGGFKAEDLKDVCDPILTKVFYSKWEEEEDKIFTLGMNYDEACAFVAKLKDMALQMDSPYDEYGEIEEDLVDFDAFAEEFPEELRGQIESDHRGFENFIMELFYLDTDFFRDGENPFRSEQTEWEPLGEGELEVREYHSNDWCDDLYVNFPKVYELALGTYISYEATEMWYYYTVIDGRYYFLSFGSAVSGIGG